MSEARNTFKGKRYALKPIERLRRSVVLLTVICLIFPSVGNAWNDKTHIVIAYIAYRNLRRHTKERVDEVLVLHPLYKQWTKGVKPTLADLIAFIRGATWPDCIQNTTKCEGFKADGSDNGMRPPVSQEAWQNVGYSDRYMHKILALHPAAICSREPIHSRSTKSRISRLSCSFCLRRSTATREMPQIV